MATGIRARLTPVEGRRFGLTVGGAFLILAGVMWLYERWLAAAVLASLGSILAVAGLILPTHLGPVEHAWMALAHAISRVTTPAVMAVMYFVVLTPLGVLRRMAARNPLVHDRTAGGFWKERPPGARRSASMERQF